MTLRLAGSFAVVRDGVAADARSIGSRKARLLLQLLAVHRGRVLPVDRLAETLWGDEPPSRPAENVATIVSRLRSALGPAAIVGGRDGYRLGDVAVDLDEAGALVQEARRRLDAGEPALAAVAATRALDLVGDGTALTQEPYADWAEPARVEAGALVRQAWSVAAEAALATDDPATAVAVAGTAVAADATDEAAGRLLMRALVASGVPARALTVYEQLRANLADELGVDPAPQTRQLHQAILREEAGRPATTARPAGPGWSSSLVGRAAELTTLRAALTAAAGGRAATVVIVGEAGIGKTRLAEELVEQARALGATVLSARCYDAERSLFLQPFAELISRQLGLMSPAQIRRLLGDRAPVLARLVPEVAQLGPWPEADRPEATHADLRRRLVFDAVVGLLRGLCDDGPVVLSLDDLHNAGLSTVELVHYLTRRLAPARLLVVATVRAGEGAPALDLLADVTARLDLGPLDAEAVRRLAADRGRGELAEQILRRTRGHPLFVVEALRGLDSGEAGLPASLQAAVHMRVRQAGPGVEELLRTASVIGASVDPVLLARVLEQPVPSVARRCEEALAARLLVVTGREYEFANDLIREVLYQTTPEPTRVAHHLRAAELLEDRPETVAEHAAAAGDWPRAARAFLLAGEAALAAFAATDAHALLDRALAAGVQAAASLPGPAHAELTGRLLVTRGRVREVLMRYQPALEDHRAAVEAAREAGDRRLEMVVLRELAGDVPVALGRPIEESVDYLHRALRIAETLGDRRTATSVLGRLGVLSANHLRLDQGLDVARRGVAVARSTDDDIALAVGLDGLKTVLYFLGELDELAEVCAELEPLVRRQGNLNLLQWTVFESAQCALGGGDWDAAVNRVRAALEVNRRSGYGAYGSWFLAHLGRLEARPGGAGHGPRARSPGGRAGRRHGPPVVGGDDPDPARRDAARRR